MRHRIRHTTRQLLAIGALVWLPPVPVPAHEPAPSEFERRELSIPVRDGVKLFAVALIPKQMSEPVLKVRAFVCSV